MTAAVGLTDGLGLDSDRCIRVIPRHITSLTMHIQVTDVKRYFHTSENGLFTKNNRQNANDMTQCGSL